MYSPLRPAAALPALLGAISVCCTLGLSRDPDWVVELEPQLRCGMTLSQVRSLTDREIKVMGTSFRLGTHWVDGKMADIWLGFQDGGLVTVTTGRIDGLASVRRTPKKNLRTGELIFVLSVSWTEALDGGGAIYLNGHLLAEEARASLFCELSSGEHHLRFVKEGHEPIEKHFTLGPDDPGDYHLDLTSAARPPKNK